MTKQTWEILKRQNWLAWIAGLAVIVILTMLWGPLSHVGEDTAMVRRWIESLGPLAPLAFFLLNVAQIVVAPIPGYPVQVLGGILFGLFPGSVYTISGMVVGGTLAAWLGRRLGRPWLEGRMPAQTLEQWSRMAHIDSFWTWWIILLIPLGDLPYFFAGLSRISLSRFALAILISRGPFTVLIVWLGHSVTELPLTWIALVIASVGALVLLGVSQRQRIENWGRAYVFDRLESEN